MKRLITSAVFVIVMLSIFPIVGQADEDERRQYYYVLVDRFQNSTEVTEEGVDRDDPDAFHGGDLRGLQERVDHFVDLGITDVVVSPLFASHNYTGAPVLNYEQIQATFGTREDVSDTVEAFHDEGLNVIVHLPLDAVSDSSPLMSEDWVSDDGELDLTSGSAADYFSELVTTWQSEFNVDGFYVEDVADVPTSFLETVTGASDDLFWIGEAGELSADDADGLMNAGMDRIVNRDFDDDAKDYFYDINTDMSLLLDDPLRSREDVVHYMDSYSTDRFTNAMEESGLHPITRWKMALTYLYMTPNEPWLYQGAEHTATGQIEDGSTHDMMNFLAGDDQVTKHIEKLANINENFAAVRDGEMNVLHQDDNFLVFERVLDDDRVIVTINNSAEFRKADLDHLDSGLELRGLILNDLVRENDDGTYTVSLERESTNVYNVQASQGVNWLLVSIFGGVMGLFVVFAIVIYMKNAKERRKA
ncbi:glycosidase [Alkalibacillus flavidus]|uniref:Glycosidase n=1 Tax=Alkalibacillus flavidus TaxID=546021 RepID=A0ABV2KV10_9BACI